MNRIAIVAIAILSSTSPAIGQFVPAFRDILKTSHADRVCIEHSEGVRRVDPAMLAAYLLDELDFSRVDEARINTGRESSRNRGQESPRDNFHIRLFQDKELDFEGTLSDEGQRKLSQGRNSFESYLIDERSTLFSSPYRVVYTVEDLLDLSSGDRNEVRRKFFEDDQRIIMLCPNREERGQFWQALRIRGKVGELPEAQPAADNASGVAAFNKLEPAQLSFLSDEISNDSTVALRFVTGIDVAHLVRGEKGPYSVIPFVSYQLSDTDSADESDVHQVTPGMVFSFPVELDLGDVGFGDRVAISAFGTFDFEQDARTARLRAQWDLNPFSDEDLGGTEVSTRYCYSDIVLIDNALKFHCRLQALAELAHVIDAGTSPDLAEDEDDQFFGIGGEAKLSFFTAFPQDSLSFLNDFTLGGSYRYLGIVEGSLEEQNRWMLSLSYIPPDLKYLELRFSYEDGENIETFQDEERLQFSLGFRY